MKKTLLMAACLTAATLSSQAQTFTNAGFEAWTGPSGLLQLEHPDGWTGSDATINELGPLLLLVDITPKKQLSKSTEAHSGSFAAQVTTKFLGDTVGNVPGLLLNAKINIDLGAIGGNPDLSNFLSYVKYTGGTPVLGKKVENVKAWVRLDGSNQDRASIIVLAMKKAKTAGGQDTMVAIGNAAVMINPNAANSYVEATANVIYTDPAVTATDTLIVAFSSSAIIDENTVRTAGNTLLVDDVSMTTSDVVSIRQPVFRGDVVLVYPNPASRSIYFNLNTAERAEDYTLTICDIAGRTVHQQQLKQLVNEQSLSGWAKGSYFYTLHNTRSQQSVKGQFAVQ
ncbi:T9SS type A sorting domain-containing protein [Taibaiella helva]|uniref:T9SS type A sorting domain-containing protein n=1 Tax=Taibaiella helva TaxID=2301235 RepID=UPI000E5976BB|nr:T9SS type A sorting domain-containing protein [Taibaiella helva]